MAPSPGLERPIRLFLRCHTCPPQVFVSSIVLHLLCFALAGWVTHGKFRTLVSASDEHVTRSYAVHFLVPARPPTTPEPRPEPKPERRPPQPPGLVVWVKASAVPLSRTTVAAPARPVVQAIAPPQPAVLTEELAPGTIEGVGKIIPTSRSDSSGGGGLAGMLGLRVPTTREGPPRRGLDRVAELLGVASSACPELRPPAAWAKRQLAVAVAFVVDTTGAVDPATLRVIESPDRTQTEHRLHSRIYVVGATVGAGSGSTHPAAYDSVVTENVMSHVAELEFLPALRNGQAIRSTVLVSCQTS